MMQELGTQQQEHVELHARHEQLQHALCLHEQVARHPSHADASLHARSWMWVDHPTAWCLCDAQLAAGTAFLAGTIAVVKHDHLAHQGDYCQADKP